MHELSITRNIVGLVAERSKGRKVSRVKLKIGKLSGIEVQAIRFIYDEVARGTDLEGSKLEIDEVDGVGECSTCRERLRLDQPIGVCPCPKRAPLVVLSGEELLVQEMEVE